MSPTDGPKYRRIAADLRERIRSGEYPAGSALPPQRRLGESYGVTLMTMRQALRELEMDGLVEQHAGRGTFVLRPAPAHHLHHLRSLAEELAMQGAQVATTVIARQERKLPGKVSRALDREPDARGLRLERLRAVAGRAVLHQVSWIPDPWGAQVRDCDFTVEPLYSALNRRAGLSVARAREELTAQLMPDRIARLLDRPAGGPVLAGERITYDERDRPFVVDHALILDQRLKVVTERRSSSMENTWQLGSN
jgi:GntR family transcriptional regulator